MSELSFDTDGDGGTVIGGGGVVISNDPLSGPLVISTYGMRNPEGKVVTKGEFPDLSTWRMSCLSWLTEKNIPRFPNCRSEGTAAYHPSAGHFKGFTSTCNSVRYSSCRFVSFISIWYSSSGTPQSSYPDSCMQDTNWENTSVILCS